MNHSPSPLHNEGSSGILHQAIDAVLREPSDDQAVARVLQRALALQSTDRMEEEREGNSDIVRPSTRVAPPTIWLKPFTRGLSLMAATAACALLALWLTTNVGPVAFAQIADRVKAISTARFHMTMNRLPDNSQRSSVSFKNDVLRFETGPLIQLIDTRNNHFLALETVRKLSQVLEIEQPDAPKFANPIVELAAARDRAVKSLGSEQLAGKKVQVYRLENLTLVGMPLTGDLTLWADPESRLPVKIEFVDNDPKHRTSIVFDNFEWDPDLPNEQFAWTAPEGFRPGEIFLITDPKAPKTGTEKRDVNAGILYAGRVPSYFAIDRGRQTLTTILRDPETTPVQNSLPTQLRQLNMADGEERWTEDVTGTRTFGFHAEQQRIATIVGQEIQLRDLTTGKILSTLESAHIIGNLAISNDGTLLAHGFTSWPKRSKDPITGGVELWNLELRSSVRTIDISDRVESLQFSPDGNRIVVGSSGSIRLFSAHSGDMEQSWAGSGTAAFSPDGKRLAIHAIASSADDISGQVDLIDLETKETERSLVCNPGNGRSWLLSIAFSEDGQRVAAGDWNGSITVWNVADGKPIGGAITAAGGVHCVRFLESSRIITGSEDGMLQIHTLEE